MEEITTPRIPTAAATERNGTDNVGLEPVQGISTEGFEVGLRFETAVGEAIGVTLWSDFVQSDGNPSTTGSIIGSWSMYRPVAKSTSRWRSAETIA